MKKKYVGKIPVIGIIVIFVGVSTFSSAVEINSEVTPSYGYTEKISIIIGGGIIGHHGNSINISSGNVLVIAYTTEGFYIKSVNQVYIEHFIGYCEQGSFGGGIVIGFALGNIEWN